MRRPRACLASTHPGGAGAPPGGQYGLPARSLADGGRPCSGWPRKARPGAVRKTPANKPRLRKLVWVARRAAPRRLERDRGHTKTMDAPLGAPSPSLWRGDKRREGRRAYPGPRQIIRVRVHGCLKIGCLKIGCLKIGCLKIGCLKSEFVNKRWRSMWRRRAAIRKYSSHVLTAIDVNFGAIQICACVGAQHVAYCGNLIGSSEPLERDLLDDFIGSGRQD